MLDKYIVDMLTFNTEKGVACMSYKIEEDEGKEVVWDCFNDPGPTLQELNDVARVEFPGMPIEKLEIYAPLCVHPYLIMCQKA